MKGDVAPPSLFVTGTDTGIGKSVASAALLHAWRARGWRAVGMKPVASGCERTAQGWRNEDALALQAASDPVPAYPDINPYALEHPLAPELAAADAGVHIALGPILDAHARLHAQADVVVVEGVGGWMAPITPQLDQKTLARALDLQVVLVVGLRLGCINHARLTARAILADGLHLAGWIANEIDPAMARIDDNVEILHRVLPAPCLGRLPHATAVDAAAMAAALDPGRLSRR
jgi:dethiobiotin synthetase